MSPSMQLRLSFFLPLFLLLGGCGEGTNLSQSNGVTISPPSAPAPPPSPQIARPASPEEAARFLAQATFGPKNKAEIDRLMTIGYEAWFDEQFAAPSASYDQWFTSLDTSKIGEAAPNISGFYTFAVQGNDQLRQRMTWALSQIFVVSDRTGPASLSPAVGLNAYFDVLRTSSFGTYRELLDNVTHNSFMAVYLTYLGNERENYGGSPSIPDNNYAREIMQLFSIGLYQLNQDGSLKLSNGRPVETYSAEDIFGLSKVFTGFTFASSSDKDTIAPGTGLSRDNAFRERMGFDKNRHSTSEKRFLNTVIPATATPQPVAGVKTALDTISNHPNVGPFFGRQLIQRFVTSNPSPDYVARVAATFNDNGRGVRGDLKAVIKAILLDPEARDRTNISKPTWGKVREPVQIAANMMRTLDARSTLGGILMNRNSNCLFDSGRMNFIRSQAPGHAATVFNFYRPNFTPPASELAKAQLHAPEFQILDPTAITEWSNFVVNTFDRDGTGIFNSCDVAANKFTYAELLPLADSPDQLVDRITLLFLAGNISSQRRSELLSAVRGATGSTGEAVRLNRIRVAMTLVIMSPEYLVQK